MKAEIKKFLLSHTIAVVIMGALAVILVGDIIYNLCRTDTKKINTNLIGYEVENQDEYMLSKSEVASDIEGMTQYDKYMMGLDWHDGSDSDDDGLTDKEEIEIYGTDPLKASTADDLYKDGYKVQNGMNPLTYYEMSDVKFENNGCTEISFLTVNANTLGAYAEYSTANQPLTDYKINTIYQEFYIHDYEGAISIDVSDILTKNNVKLSNISIYISNTFVIDGVSEPESCKYTADGNVLTLSKDFESGSGYCIYVSKRNSFIDNIIAGASSAFNKKTSSETTFLFESNLIYQFMNLKSGKQFVIYYPEQGTETKNEALKKAIYNYYSADFFTEDVTYDSIEFVAASDSEISKKNKLYSSVLMAFYRNSFVIHKNNWYNMIFSYREDTMDAFSVSTYSAAGRSDTDTVTKYKNYHTSFDPYVDELPFQNFQSKYGTSGNCAAIAYLTASLFNKGYFPTSGSYAGIEWNLDTDAENATLSDAGLFDYKTASFVDDNTTDGKGYLDETKLTSGEAEFIKMMGATFAESADRLPYLNEYFIDNSSQYVDWSVAETIINRLNQGKIVNMSIYLNDGTGHEVTVYDYTYTSENNVTFRIYDSNMPQDQNDAKLTSNACYMYCTKTARADGTYEMKYIYAPVKENTKYMATSESSLMSTSALILSDDDWNILN